MTLVYICQIYKCSMDTEKLRSFCLNLPGATEGIKWEDHLCFMVGEKMFLITGLDDSSNVNIKVTDEDFDFLTEREGIIPAPYMAKNKWVGITKRSALKKKEWEHYVKQSYEIIKSKLPKKKQREIDGA
jgi:predicted DNA-binding protein (MmcQ/YjbR family)